ncbi:MAG: hypothetical protein BWY83_03417 [bacterium ADurb.Bin478]|nr:MAG: hypothetical protein BWY83_03417 [bacterium ADurb.Bin478]
MVAQVEAKMVAPMISAGSADLSTARAAMTVMGMSVMLPVLRARNMIIESEAVSLSGFRDCSSCMAFSPMGVAAFESPSQLAEMLSTMAPMAGWSSGMSGNSRRLTGLMARASRVTRPAS